MCRHGSHTQCHLADNKQQVTYILGGVLGALVALSVAGLLNYLRKNPSKFRQELQDMLKSEVMIAVSLGGELFDIVGDAYLFHDVVKSDSAMKQELGAVFCVFYLDTFKRKALPCVYPRPSAGVPVIISWFVFFSLAVIVSLMSLYLNVRAYIKVMRQRRAEFGLDTTVGEDFYTAKHRTLLVD